MMPSSEQSASSAANGNDQGRMVQNILYFARVLRGAGMRVGPASAVDAVDAVQLAGIGSRDDLYWTLHAVFVKRHEDRQVYHEAFQLFWRSRDLIDKMIQMFSPMANPEGPPEKQKAAQNRVAQSLFSGQENRKELDRPEVEIDAMFTASEKEILRTKDFAMMNAAEIAEARRAITSLTLPMDEVRTRRFKTFNRPATIDARRMLASSMRTGGDLILPKFKTPRTVHPPVVVLADISGSMSQYSRIFLHFMHALMEDRSKVHAFLFGTRLTNVTRQLRRKDPDEALLECSDAVEDWSGGTRIGTTLHEFNRIWSRRVLGQGAIVLLITDGLERDIDHDLAYEMDRLHRSCRRLIWLNPLLRFDGFKAAAKGIRTMLPHVDEFRPVHSIDALQDLCTVLSMPKDRRHDPKSWLRAISVPQGE